MTYLGAEQMSVTRREIRSWGIFGGDRAREPAQTVSLGHEFATSALSIESRQAWLHHPIRMTRAESDIHARRSVRGSEHRVRRQRQADHRWVRNLCLFAFRNHTSTGRPNGRRSVRRPCDRVDPMLRKQKSRNDGFEAGTRSEAVFVQSEYQRIIIIICDPSGAHPSL